MARVTDDVAAALVRRSRALSRELGALHFGAPVVCTYAPLEYAREPFERYLERYAKPRPQSLLLGMNPGPFGMVQTGVPFGEVAAVREFLGIEGRVRRPEREHPKRPVLGFGCTRSEVSGRRLWGWARARHGDAASFSKAFFVWNWCPLAFVSESGANLTPDKLPAGERGPLEAACDGALDDVIRILSPKRLIGVGRFAEKRLTSAAARVGFGGTVGAIPHPSPASPLANRGWEPLVEAALAAM
jgi:single-strand selective monofunctional uracil DNA glycosylase